MLNMQKPDFRAGEDENYCCAQRIYREERFRQESEDYILPDYLPDVKKTVGLYPQVIVKGRFMGSGTLEYNGEVRYKILYISEDDRLKSVTFFTGFEDKIGGEGFGEECVECIEPEVRAPVVRMINPRKFSISAQIGATVTVWRRRCCLPELYGALTSGDEEALVCLSNELDAVNVLSLRENGLTVSEDLNFDAATPSADELIFFSVDPAPLDCRLYDGEAQFRGNVRVHCLMTSAPDASGQRETIVFERTVFFTQSVKNKALHEGGTAQAALTVENCECRLREDEFGQKRVLECDLTYACELTVYYPKKTLTVADAYSVVNEVDLTYDLSDLVSLAAPLKGNFSVNENLTVDLPEGAGFALTDVFLTPELRVDSEDGRAVLNGTCAVTLLLRDGAGGFDMRRASFPLRFRTDVQTDGGEIFGRICARAEGVRARMDKDRLSLDFEVGYYGCVLKNKSEKTMTALRILPEKRTVPGRRGSILLYYPEASEGVFETAKKYGVRPESIEKQMEEKANPIFIFRK